MTESTSGAGVGVAREPDSSDRELDLVVFGATGFTGRQAAAYVAAHAPKALKWGLAARSASKLERVRSSLAVDVPLIQADAQDALAIDAMAQRTKVVLTTVGPYARYGTALFAACAAAGTHYVDITGETAWVRRMIDVHHTTAKATGAVMVPFCGFDSVPSDLGAWMMVDWIRRHWQQSTRSVRMGFQLRGGVNGGTLASALHMGENPQLKREIARPFLLDPDPEVVVARVARAHRDPTGPWYDPDLGDPSQGGGGRWLAPFIMASINTRVVRRSAAVWAAQGQPYGDDFAYQEGMRAKSRGLARMGALGLGGAVLVLSTSVGRMLVRRLAPSPGEGPSEAQMDGGFFKSELVAEASDGRKVRGRVSGQGDPGNRCTVRMLCESAFALCGDHSALPAAQLGGGVWTPAAALGGVLLDRLRAAGMTFEVTAPTGVAA